MQAFHFSYRSLRYVIFVLFCCLSNPQESLCQIGTAAALLEMDFGSLGTTTELILTPKVDSQIIDPNWIYIVLPNGLPNMVFPAAFPTVPLPLPGGIPADIVDLSQQVEWWNEAHKRTNVVDSLVNMSQILFSSFTVDAKLEWQDSGFVVADGQNFQLSAAGIWSVDKNIPANTCGPEGLPPPPSDHTPLAGHPAWPKPEAVAGALIGRVGNGTAFVVGSGGTFTAESSGNLFFVCNDVFDGGAPGGSCIYCPAGNNNTHMSNNTGEVKVSFSIIP